MRTDAIEDRLRSASLPAPRQRHLVGLQLQHVARHHPEVWSQHGVDPRIRVVDNRPEDGGAIQSSVSYGLLPADWSVGRVPDGGSNWVLTLPTIGIPNIAASLGKPELIKINEWMADPASGDDWFEIYNPSSQPVALGGLHVTSLPSRAIKRLNDASAIHTGQRR